MRPHELKNAMDKAFAPLTFTKAQQARVFSAIKGDKPMKHKLKLNVVLALALVLVGLTAIAVVSLRETGKFIATTQQQEGDFAAWQPDKKAQLVTDLIAQGYIKETEELKQLTSPELPPEDADLIANEAMAAFTGEGVEAANFLSIMQAAWGPFETWSAEDQAWYSALMQEIGNDQQGKTVFVQPEGPVTREQAIAIAKTNIANAYSVPESALDGYTVTTSFQIPEFAEPGDTRAYWYVCLDSWNTGMKEEDLPFATIDLFVNPDTGELLETVEEKLAQRARHEELRESPTAQAIRAFVKESGESRGIMFWSLENKAAFTERIAPLIRQFKQEHTADDVALAFSLDNSLAADFAYALPDEQALPFEQAKALAREALVTAYHLTDEQIALIADQSESNPVNVFYDISDADRPLWKFLFTPPSLYGPDKALAEKVQQVYGDRHIPSYKVELDARTGETVRVFTMDYLNPTPEVYKEAL